MSSNRPLDNPSPIVLQPPSITSATTHKKPWEPSGNQKRNSKSEKELIAELWAGEDGFSLEEGLGVIGGGDEEVGLVGGTEGEGEDSGEEVEEQLDGDEVFDLIRSITDPEHENLTLEQLMVVYRSGVKVSNTLGRESVFVEFTPTIPHCSMATLIGLTLRMRLMRSLSTKYRLDIRIKPGAHQSENAINKQLNDKERCIAAGENQHLLGVVEGCLSGAGRRGGKGAGGEEVVV